MPRPGCSSRATYSASRLAIVPLLVRWPRCWPYPNIAASCATTSFSIIEGKSKADGGLKDILGGMGQKNGATKQVDLRGVKATAISPAGGNQTALVWQEKDSGIWVAIHGKLSLDEAVKTAEGLK